ncbi:MAG TPA: glycosyltransferase family 4 protein, partial [Thermoanaerobaculia bacterium]|nr:glycosyltransferase family 4 protein [Thermoanaerobaculia bacterium]
DFYARLQRAEAAWVEVPFGIDRQEISACAKPKDNLLLWGGGVWEWLDPETAVDAVVRLNTEGLRCRLLFLGRTRPNVAAQAAGRENRFDALLARGGPYVSANDDWVPYRERLSWLRASKIAIMLHHSTLEAEYSIRTRLFDAITAGVPVVTTEEGFAAELVEKEDLGLVVPPDDTAAVAEAVRKLLTDDGLYLRCVENLQRMRPRFAWEVVTGPLIEKISEWQTQAR